MNDDPTCRICGARKSLHVATDKGPFTHPREASGEGVYVLVGSGTLGFGPMHDDMPWERWELRPTVTVTPDVTLQEQPANPANRGV
jgi:hypothetical protein